MKWVSSLFSCALFLTLIAFGETGPPATSAKDLELIHTVLKRNQASIANIKSIRLEQESELVSVNETQDIPEDPPVGEQKVSKRTSYISRGEWFRSDVKRVTEVPAKGYRKESREQVILNGTSFIAILPAKKNEIISFIEHASISKIREILRPRVEGSRPELALDFSSATHYGFPSLLESPRTTWSIEHKKD
ncbi:MAG: hypothetical protein SGI88_14120 [Candidatus Hydrogenedentes bacterium]|nr:hypothetical protein [Candidatus Hydrogenedentota bacterium]